jgi:tryptophanyl-tRNA synthetase
MKKIVSGIQPTNRLTLGNYLGAIKELVTLQDQYEMYIFVADLHALSVNFDAKTLYQNKLNLVASYQALGLDLTKNIVFNQSDVAAHTALS